MVWNNREEIESVVNEYNNLEDTVKKICASYKSLQDKVRLCLKLYRGASLSDTEGIEILCGNAFDTCLTVKLAHELNRTFNIPYAWIAEQNIEELTDMIDRQRWKEAEEFERFVSAGRYTP